MRSLTAGETQDSVDRACAEAIFHAINEPLLVLDDQLKVRKINRAFERIFGGEAAIGRPLFKIDDGLWSVSGLRGHLLSLAREEKAFTDWESDFELPKLGLRTLSISGRRLPSDSSVGTILLVVNDVSARRHAAETAALRRSEARQREFVANISHELMTPITTIRGYSEALLSGALQSPDRRLKFIQIIDRHAARLTQVLEDILHLSAYDAGAAKSAAEVVGLRRAVLQAVRGWAEAARQKGVSTRVRVPAGLKVAIDRAALSRVLAGVVHNGIRYNRPNGRLFIRAVRIGKRVLVSVQDTGIGVPRDDIPLIFERFHRAENARALAERGAGLGLAIAKAILSSRGCRIWIESSEGKGSTFFFTLPLA